jgi:hypothetical protein
MATIKVQYEKVQITMDTPATTGTSAVSGTMVGAWTGLLHSIKVKTPSWASSACTAGYLDIHDGDGDIVFTSSALAEATTYILTADRMFVTETPYVRMRLNSIESTGDGTLTGSQSKSSVPTVLFYLY